MADPEHWERARTVARQARDLLWKRYGRDPNVVGVAFGPPTRRGRTLDTPACVVYVVRKLPVSELRAEQVIPAAVEVPAGRIETDVVETGKFYAHEHSERLRPALPGVSIGHGDVTAGTLGCLVTDTDTGQLSILSNNHVLANSNAGITGDSIFQPGPADAEKTIENVIASLTRFVPVKFDGTLNEVDCAVAAVINDCDVYADVMDGGRMTGPDVDQPAVGLLFAGSAFVTLHCPINSVADQLHVELIDGPDGRSAVTALDAAPPGAAVQKTGRTTEYSTGRITSIDATAEVGYGAGRTATYHNLIVTTAMSCGGDSGSVLCRGGSGNVIPAECISLCPMIKAAEDLTGIPFTQEWVSIRYARDTYAATTLIGQWLLDVVFDNIHQQSYATRAQQLQVAPEDRAFAQALYAKYGGGLTLALFNPDRPDLRVTPQQLTDAEEALSRAQKYLLADEIAAAQATMTRAWGTVGMNGRDLINEMNNPVLYVELREIAAKVKAITDPHA